MSILLNALEKAQKSSSPTGRLVQSFAVRPQVTPAPYRRMILYVVILSIMLLGWVMRRPSQPKKIETKVVHLESQVKAVDVTKASEEASSRDVLLSWVQTDPRKILMRLQVAPESLLEDRDVLMAKLLDVKAWHVAYALSKALPSARPSEAEQKMLAVHALEHDDYAQAASLYKLLAENDPDSAELWLGLGIASGKQGNYEQAEKAFSKAIELMDEGHVAYTYVLQQLDSLATRA